MRNVIAVLLYITTAFLTGGYYVNHRCGESSTCGIDATLAGAAAPAYWAGRAAIEVTK